MSPFSAGIDPSISLDQVRELMGTFGAILNPSEEQDTHSLFSSDRESWCFIAFDKREDAQKARLGLHDQDTPLGHLTVDWHNNSSLNRRSTTVPDLTPGMTQISLYVTFEQVEAREGLGFIEREELNELFGSLGPLESIIIRSHTKDSRKVRTIRHPICHIRRHVLVI